MCCGSDPSTWTKLPPKQEIGRSIKSNSKWGKCNFVTRQFGGHLSVHSVCNPQIILLKLPSARYNTTKVLKICYLGRNSTHWRITICSETLYRKEFWKKKFLLKIIFCKTVRVNSSTNGRQNSTGLLFSNYMENWIPRILWKM